MGISGHKLKGSADRSVIAINPLIAERDVYGRIVSPYKIFLEKESQVAIASYLDNMQYDLVCLAIPDNIHRCLLSADRLYFSDCQGKARFLEIIEQTSVGQWLSYGWQNAHFSAEAVLTWRRPQADGYYKNMGKSSAIPVLERRNSLCG